jgi:hypothetical protein
VKTLLISFAVRFGIPVAVLALGMHAGAINFDSYLEPHTESNGFAGLAMFFVVYPALTFIFAFIAVLARNTRAFMWLMSVSIFFAGMIIGGFVH